MLLFHLALPLVILVTISYSLLGVITRPIDRSGRLFHRLMHQWSSMLLWLLRVKVRVHGAERLDRRANYLYIANHSSYLDIIAIGARVPDDILFIYKEELTRIPVFGWCLKLSPFIMVRRSDPRQAMRSIDQAAEEIRERHASVVIFPEGTRSADGRLGEFKRGGFLLAMKTGVPLVPLAIQGSHKLLPRNDWRVRAGTIDVIVGEPVPGRMELTREDERTMQDRLHGELEEMLGGGDEWESTSSSV